jgi:hypothetical protein
MDSATRDQVVIALTAAANKLSGAEKSRLHPRIVEGLKAAEAFIAEKVKEQVASYAEQISRVPVLAKRLNVVDVRGLEQFHLPSASTLDKWAKTTATQIMTDALAGTNFEATGVASMRIKRGHEGRHSQRIRMDVRYVGSTGTM